MDINELLLEKLAEEYAFEQYIEKLSDELALDILEKLAYTIDADETLRLAKKGKLFKSGKKVAKLVGKKPSKWGKMLGGLGESIKYHAGEAGDALMSGMRSAARHRL